jgi:hypothetical protein
MDKVYTSPISIDGRLHKDGFQVGMIYSSTIKWDVTNLNLDEVLENGGVKFKFSVGLYVMEFEIFYGLSYVCMRACVFACVFVYACKMRYQITLI